MCRETSVVPVAADALVLVKLFFGTEFVKVMLRQSLTFALNTRGRGRLLGLSWSQPFTSVVSDLRAKIKPSGIAAPMRFSMMGWGSATTSAFIVRWHGATGGGAAGLVFGGTLLLSVGFSSRAAEAGATLARSLAASGDEG